MNETLQYTPATIAPEQEGASVRVVVPAYHAENTLKVCIEAIVNSRDVGNLEIVVADNGGNERYASSRVEQYPVKYLLCQEQASAAYARNCGAADFENGVLVFVDADVEIEKDTIAKLIHPIQTGHADATLGNYSSCNIEDLNFFQKYKQLYISKVYARNEGFVKNDFWTAICAIRADVFHGIGGFDSSYKGAAGEDTEFGIRLSQQNWRILSVPVATGKHLHFFDALKLIKNDFRKGVRTMSLYLNKGHSFSNHRHAKKNDIFAVFWAVNVALTTFMAISFSGAYSYQINALLVSASLLSYLVARYELISVFLKRNIAFLVRAIPLMYLLDLVRAFSVVIAIGVFLYLKAASKNTERRSLATDLEQ